MSRKVINVVVGGGGDNSVEYLAGPFEDSVYTTLQMFSYLMKIRRNNNKIAIGGFTIAMEATKDNTLAFAITPNAKIVDADEQISPIKHYLILLLGEDVYNSFTRITEEEFYAIPE